MGLGIDLTESAERGEYVKLSQGQRLIRENKIVESAEENISMFKNMVKDFFDNRLSIIKSLQMI